MFMLNINTACNNTKFSRYIDYALRFVYIGGRKYFYELQNGSKTTNFNNKTSHWKQNKYAVISSFMK